VPLRILCPICETPCPVAAGAAIEHPAPIPLEELVCRAAQEEVCYPLTDMRTCCPSVSPGVCVLAVGDAGGQEIFQAFKIVVK
jgi:hypothetical protein